MPPVVFEPAHQPEKQRAMAEVVALALDEDKFPESTQRLIAAAFKGKEAAMPKFVKWFK